MKLIIIAFILVAAPPIVKAVEFRDGDIIFQTSQSSQSEAIQRATHSKFSHMGLILYRNGKPFVFEAVNPVKFTPLKSWIQRGKGEHYVVKRLKDSEILSDENIRKIQKISGKFEGKPYDLAFGWSDDRIYCSELVWKIYDRALGIKIGQLQTLSTFDLTDPVVKQKIKERYGSDIPMNETVISPQSMFESPNLVTVGTH